MKKLILIVITLGIIKSTANAQNGELQYKEIDSTLLYKNGEGILLNLGKGGASKINFFTTIQSGFKYATIDSGTAISTNNRMSLNLARLYLNMSVLKNKVLMGLVTDFTSTTPILEGWVGFKVFNKKTTIYLGQRQTHTNNRLAMDDERYAAFMAQSSAGKSADGSIYGGLMQNFVGTTREGGLYVESNFSLNKLKVYPSVSITTGEGQNFFDPTPNVGLKYGGRLDVLPLGDFIKNNAFIAHDIYREPTPKIALGIAGSINKMANSTNGSGDVKIAPIYNNTGALAFADYTKLVADAMFKYKGFSITGEYVNSIVTGQDLFTNATATKKLMTDTSSAYYNIGTAIHIHTAYVCTNGLAIDVRYTTVKPEFSAATSLIQRQSWYGLGINKYINYNAIKVGASVNYINDKLILLPNKKLIVNVAVQIIM